MDFGQFKTVCAAFVNRTPASFVQGVGGNSIDLLALAVNRAKLYMQRSNDFEWCLQTVKGPVNVITANVYTDFTTDDGNNTPVKVKRVKRCYVRNTATPTPEDIPIPYYSKDSISGDILKHRDNYVGDRVLDRPIYPWPPLAPGFRMFQQGQIISWYPKPKDTTLVMVLDAVCLLPDYTLDTDEDFFLDYCNDYMMYRSISELNIFLKDDQKVPLDTEKMEEAWASVLAWNTGLCQPTSEDAEL